MVLLNFADVDIVGEFNPRVRYLEQFYQAIHGDGHSLYVLIPFNAANAGRGLDCFLVPSFALDGNGKLAQSIDKNFIEKKKPKKETFHLTSGEHLSTYRCPENHLIEFLEGLCRVWSDIPGCLSSTFRPPGDLGASYLDSVITTQLDILTGIMEYEFKGSLGTKTHRVTYE